MCHKLCKFRNMGLKVFIRHVQRHIKGYESNLEWTWKEIKKQNLSDGKIPTFFNKLQLHDIEFCKSNIHVHVYMYMYLYVCMYILCHIGNLFSHTSTISQHHRNIITQCIIESYVVSHQLVISCKTRSKQIFYINYYIPC